MGVDRLFTRVYRELSEVARQPGEAWLAVRDHELGFVHAVLDSIERTERDLVILRFAPETSSPEAQRRHVCERLTHEIARANELRRARDQGPWELPRPDARAAPEADIERVLQLGVACVPPGFRVLLAVLAPARPDANTVTSWRAWSSGLSASVTVLLRAPFDPDGAPDLAPEVALVSADFGADAARLALRDSVTDGAASQRDRAGSAYQLAAIDEGRGQWADAYGGYAAAFELAPRSSPIGALSLLGAADVLRKSGRFDRAKIRYQQSLALAASLPGPLAPLWLNGLAGAGRCCAELGELRDAAEYLEMAREVAERGGWWVSLMDVGAMLGAVHYAGGDLTKARAQWEATWRVMREQGSAGPIVETVLGGLERVYAAIGDQPRLSAVRAALRIARGST